jgi:uncharacterized spore protein YtfJ
MDTTMTSDEMVRQISAIPDQLGVSACFGPPVERAGRTVIPAARVSFGYGLGFGRGSGGKDLPSTDGHMGADGGEGEGGGGGGGGSSTPVAVIHIKDDGVEVEPIVDSTRISLAGTTFAAWAIFWITWTVRTIAKERAKTRRHEIDKVNA